jgi:hypothetical protein
MHLRWPGWWPVAKNPARDGQVTPQHCAASRELQEPAREGCIKFICCRVAEAAVNFHTRIKFVHVQERITSRHTPHVEAARRHAGSAQS